MKALTVLRHALGPLLWGGAATFLCLDLLSTVTWWKAAPALIDKPPSMGWSRIMAKAKRLLSFGERKDPAIWEEVAYSLAFHIRAGETISQALRGVAMERATPCHRVLRRIVQMYDAGSSLEASFEACSAENPQIAYLAGVFEMGLASGGDVPSLLCRGAESMRRRRLARDEVRSRLVEARATAGLLSFLPWAIGGLTLGRDERTRAVILADPKGRLLLAISLLLWALGNVVIVVLLRSLSPAAPPRQSIGRRG